jgi:hypothetical protein
MKSDKNMIDVIEKKLKELEQEKYEIENLYGIDENILEEYSNKIGNPNYQSNSKKISKPSKSKTIYANLPKLEASVKKESKIPYKIPESLQDSLKYEPDIKDLLEEEEFEPSFSSLSNLKIPPSMKKGYNINNYVEYINDDYKRDYLN